ncbi:FxsA family protein [Nocardia higoensis]|uniref:FxsA family protein n=1 Tax=Nocardia higoensis TaxID=228599 RepID=UPI0002FEE97C|nr:FxsA family protein [Nocardia higoensis]
MPALLFVLYVVVEIAALVAVAQWIGVFATILLLIAGSAVGMVLVGGQGRRVFDQFRRVGRGEVKPGTAVADGLLVALGAVLMFVPGLVTSVAGLLLLLPFTRALVRPAVTALAARRVGGFVGQTRYRGVVIDAEGDVVDGVVVRQWYDDGRGTGHRAIDPA